MTEEEEIRRLLWAEVKKYRTQKNAAMVHKLNVSHLGNALNGRAPPSARMCKIVGWKKVKAVVYRRATPQGSS